MCIGPHILFACIYNFCSSFCIFIMDCFGRRPFCQQCLLYSMMLLLLLLLLLLIFNEKCVVCQTETMAFFLRSFLELF